MWEMKGGAELLAWVTSAGLGLILFPLKATGILPALALGPGSVPAKRENSSGFFYGLLKEEEFLKNHKKQAGKQTNKQSTPNNNNDNNSEKRKERNK